MKINGALSLNNDGPLIIQELDLADPKPSDVLVRIVATGICHTDLIAKANTALPLPALFGHEGAGVVEKVGSAVTRVVVGDHVLLTSASCGYCARCQAGNPSYCLEFHALNMGGGRCADGSCTHTQAGKPVFSRFLGQSSFASHALVNERSAIKLHPQLPLDVMAPLGCGVLTGAAAVLNTLQPRPGSSLVLFGAGAVGLSALMAAKIAGCSRLIVVDKISARLQVARDLGATHVVDASEANTMATIRELTGGGADYVVEASGVPKVMELAIEAVGQGGSVAIVGMAGSQATVNFNPVTLQSKGANIKGCMLAGENSVPEPFIRKLIEFWKSGQLPIEKMLRFYEFDQINDAIADSLNGVTIKPVVRMPRATRS
ncbi:NAD(P)-dependent alcohol dehydrogenase [Pseudomonas silvicola]|nr:NAD(P)-dependent alcohol dehydrogenase [Pseudomonas silvicola]